MTMSKISRRAIVKLAGSLTLGSMIPVSGKANDPDETIQNDSLNFSEPARNLPVVDDVDVIVCGGGPAQLQQLLQKATVCPMK